MLQVSGFTVTMNENNNFFTQHPKIFCSRSHIICANFNKTMQHLLTAIYKFNNKQVPGPGSFVCNVHHGLLLVTSAPD